jgi:DNA-binding NtrC family response regulator
VRLLAEHFMAVYCERGEKKLAGFTEGALAMLDAHSWPGNVRELENVIERAVITSQGTISERDIAVERRSVDFAGASSAEASAPQSWAPGRTLDDIERNVILEALTYHQGNRTHTARALGISIRTLRNKLADYRRLGINV